METQLPPDRLSPGEVNYILGHTVSCTPPLRTHNRFLRVRTISATTPLQGTCLGTFDISLLAFAVTEDSQLCRCSGSMVGKDQSTKQRSSWIDRVSTATFLANSTLAGD